MSHFDARVPIKMHFKKCTIKTLYWQPDKHLNLVLITHERGSAREMRRLNRNTITNKSAEQQRTEVQSPKPAHSADTLTSLAGRASLKLQLFPPKRCMALVRLTVSDLFALLIMFSIMAIHYTHNNSNNTVYPCMCACAHQTFKHKKIGKGNNNRNSNSNVNTHIASASPKSKRRFRGKSPKSNSNAMLGFSARRDQHVVLVIAPPSLTHSQLQCCLCFSLSQ